MKPGSDYYATMAVVMLIILLGLVGMMTVGVVRSERCAAQPGTCTTSSDCVVIQPRMTPFIPKDYTGADR
jgi:hypothetical protein